MTGFELPPPPPRLFGRRDELARAAELLAAAPVLVIHGAGGVGKSAFVRRCLHDERPARPETTVSVDVRPGDDLPDALLLLRLALGGAVARVEAADVPSLVAVVLDRAEDAAATCVVEDLHHLSDARAAQLAELLARHARASRWILTGRRPITLPDGVATLELGALPDADLRALAIHACAQAAPGEVDAVLARSDGTPISVLREAASLPRTDVPPEGALVRHLSLMDLAIGLDDLAAIGSPSRDDVVERLLSQGILVRASDGYRLHDLVRQAVIDRLDPDERRQLARIQAQRLGGSERPHATLEALRAMMTSELLQDAAFLAEARRHALVRAGQGLRLWRLLSQVDAAGLTHQALEVAVTVATPESLHWLQSQPRPEGASARVAWIRGLLLAGRRADAEAEVRKMLDAAGLDAPERSDATLLLVRIALGTGNLAEAGALLAGHEAPDEVRGWRARALEAMAAMAGGDFRQALALARMVRDACVSLPPEVSLELQADVEPILLELGDAGDGLAGPDESGSQLPLRQFQMVRAMGLMARAQPDAARRMVEQLTGRLGATAVERSRFHIAAAGVCTAIGDIEGQARHLSRALAAGRDAQDWQSYQWAMAATASLNFLSGEERPILTWDPQFEPPAGIHALYLRAVTHLDALEWGRPSASTSAELLPPGTSGELTIVLGTAQAVALALDGALDDAALVAERSIARATAGGWRLWELMARHVAALVHLLREDRTRLMAAANAFQDVARGSGVTMAQHGASFLVEAAQVAPDLRAVDAVARDAAFAPRQAGWARAVLGESSPAGRLAERVTAATRALWGDLRIARFGASDGAAGGWGVDEAREVLWTAPASANAAESELVDLRRRRQFKRFIRYLAEHGGRASKEDLARDVWDLRNYDPMRDDNRIHVAIGRYRELIGDDRHEPRRLVTIDRGYAFGEDEPVTIAWRQG